MAQQAGRDGVARILEKLFLTVKFDILGTDIVAVEITEDYVLGKTSPIYHRASRKRSGVTQRHHVGATSHRGLYSIVEEALPSSLSDYDQGIFEELEV